MHCKTGTVHVSEGQYIRKYETNTAKTHNSLVVVPAVAAVLHVVHVVAGLFAEQTGTLGAGDVEALLATLEVRKRCF